jgi:hypothetical protein
VTVTVTVTLHTQASNSKVATQAKCLIGIARGNERFDEYVEAVLAKFDPASDE